MRHLPPEPAGLMHIPLIHFLYGLGISSRGLSVSYHTVVWAVVFVVAGLLPGYNSAIAQVPVTPDYILDRWQTEEGLPHSAITTIFQDRDGYLWIGTGAGLVRFDGIRFINVFEDTVPFLTDSYVWSISEDNNGVLWVGTSNGLIRYKDHDVDTFTTGHGLPDNFVRTLMQDRAGTLWVGTYGGGICQFDATAETCHHITHHEHGDDQFVNAIIEDRQGKIWVGTDAGLLAWENGAWKDVFVQDELRDQVKALIEDENGHMWVGTSEGVYMRARNGDVSPVFSNGAPIRAARSFLEDRKGALWIGTESSGLHSFSNGAVTHFEAEPELTNAYISDIFQDQEGNIWIGTYGGGLNRLKESRVKVYGAPEGLPDDIVNSIFEDSKGALWFGTSNGVARLEEQVITRYDEDSGLANGRVLSLAEDQEGALWIGTNGGGLSRWSNGTFQSLTSQNGLLGDVVFSTLVDSDGVLWAGTTRGLNRIEAGEITSYTTEDGLPDGFAVVIREDPQKDLWIGTDAGLAHLHEGEFVVYTQEHGLPNNAIRALHFDTVGTLWVGTRGGLSRFSGDRFESFTTEDGLPDNVVYHIESDDTGNVWLNTGRSGILRIPMQQLDELVDGSRTQLNPLVLDRSDGLRSTDGTGGFQPAGLKDRTGRLWFLTLGGAVAVHPEEIAPDPYQIPIHIEEIIADSSSMVSTTNAITVPYGTNRLVIRYTGISYKNPDRLLFSTQLEGLEDYWSYESNQPGFSRMREFSRLAPGTYIFRVRGANQDGVWSSNEAALRIVVPSPWWRTYWAWLGYVLFMVVGMYGIVRWRVYALERQNRDLENVIADRTQQISQQARHLEDLDLIKSQFFANISHELRTPLTLILGSTEEMREQEMDASMRRFTTIIENQGRQLLTLVSQLLDLSRIDGGGIELQLVRGNLVPFIERIVSSFMPLADRRNIALEFHPASDSLITQFDKEKLQQVISNVLSNAFNHTDSGKIHVSLESSPDTATILVRDTGSGIDPGDLPYIFDRFYQGAKLSSSRNMGSGIGLALSKELIEMHGGSIAAESTAGFGSLFRILLPVRTEDVYKEQVRPENASYTLPLLDEQQDKQSVDFPVKQQTGKVHNKPVILFVEDNPDVRQFVAMSLHEQFHIVERASGEDALSYLDNELPDLILSDVMMGGISGYNLAQQLKADDRFKHIPIILLTAQASAESIEEGLNVGVDDYITKPFSAKQLRLRIQNAISSRSVLREKYSRELVVKPSYVTIESADELFLRRAMRIVEEHIEEPAFKVDALAAELGLSRRQLQRKLRDLSNISPAEFIRNMRLDRAAQLLESDMGTVSEIAYKVGFSKPSHFSELFRKKFGKSPTEYRP